MVAGGQCVAGACFLKARYRHDLPSSCTIKPIPLVGVHPEQAGHPFLFAQVDVVNGAVHGQ